jgi:drug/metabolite transporter (DMT)-like permease
MILDGVVGALGALQLKIASKSLEFKLKHVFKTVFNKHLIIGLTLYGLAFCLVVFLLSKENLSLIYPLTSIAYIFTVLFSAWFLKEKITKYKLLAVVLIIIGNVLITYQV